VVTRTRCPFWTYVVDRASTIRWAFVDTDYTTRAEPTDISAALDPLAVTPGKYNGDESRCRRPMSADHRQGVTDS